MFWKLSSDPDIHRVQLPPAPQSHPNNVKTAVLWAVFLGANKTGHICLQNMETVHLLFLIQSKLIHYMQSLTVQGTLVSG